MTQAAELDESGIEDIYPLSPLQQGMLFHSIASGGERAYVSQLALELGGRVDRSALRDAWKDLIARHSVLRTAFEWEGLDAPVQVVHREVELPWFEHDLRQLPEATRTLELDTLLEAERIRGFELARAPALRVHLVRLEDERSALVFTFHHILLDGWSTPILIGELIELYRARREGRPAALADARPYSEYIAWIEERDTGVTEQYWRDLLRGAEPTSLTIDRSGTEGIEAPGEVASGDEKLVLDPALSREIMMIGRTLGVPTSTVVQAAWAVLLARYTGRRDVVYGVTLHGRPEDLPESEGRVGLFINTLPVRVRLGPELTARELVAALRVQQAELFRHQHTPLSRIIGWSDLPRGQRLFETVVGYQGYPVDAAHRAPMPGLSVRLLAMSDRGNYPATLLVTPGDEIELLLCFVPERLDAASVRRLLLQLRELLRSIVSTPDARLDDIELTTPDERQALLRFATGAARDFPSDRCAHHLFSARALTTPLATALSSYETRVSYAELERRANQLAHRLVRLGVGPESRVAICLPRGTELVVSMLGVLKAGGAYVPLDPTYPRQRLLHILHDCGASVLVSQSAYADVVPRDAIDPLLLDRDDFGDCPTHDPEVAVGPRNLAYVIYTSGTTGKPKGVLLEHRGLLNTALAQIETFSITHESVVLQFASPSFDASVSEIFTALIAGATLELRDSRDLLPGPDLVEMMHSRRVSVVTFPPSALAVLPEAPLAELRTLVVAGEACPGELVRRWAPGRDFVNAYGPTEVTICASAGRCPPAATRPLIGRPIANVALYVLDEQLRLTPQGVPGELYVGGPGVARGYQALPELTAERFVPSPFAPGERLYRTGDRARVTESGELDFLGRRDEQIKLRGYRIELGEIEAVLEAAPEVARAVAIVRNEPPAPRIVAYVVPRSGHTLDREALSESLRRELPEYMVPAAIVELAELPTTPNGKLDKAALPAPERPLSSAKHSPPRTPAETVLAKIWSEVLRVERVGIFDDFFALGGDSLLSMQIVSRARERGLRLGVSDIFEHPTIAGLAGCAANAPGAPAADQGSVSGELLPSPIQRWLLETPEAVPRHFNMSLFFQTSEALDIEVARLALRALVTHHDALRLVFDGARADHRSPDAIDARELLVVHDFSALPDSELSAAISAAADAVQSGFDLARGPLIRLAVFDAGRSRPQRVLWAVHHLVTDAVSMRILLEDFQSAYGALLHGEEPALPLKTSSFKDHSAAVWELAATEDVGAELAYWTAELSRPVARLPLDHRLGENDVASSAEVALSLDAESTLRLTRGLSRRLGARITEVLLTAWARAQHDHAGSNAIAVQLEMHGRDVVPGADVSRTVGWFTSFYPVVLRSSASRDPASDLEHVVRQLRAVPRAGAGFLWLRQSSGAAGEALRSLGLPEVSFNYLGQSSALAAAAGSVSIAPESAGNARDPSAIRSQLIEVNAIVVADRLQATLRYSQNLHRRETIERIARAFERELRALGELADGDDLTAPIEDEALPGVERIPLAPRDVPLPLSFGQERAWFLEQLDPGRVAYHCPFVARIHGSIDEAILRRAFEVVVQRHDGLRTTFPLVDGRAVQIVGATSDAALDVFDLRDLAAHEREAEAHRIVERQLQQPFELARGPLIRAGIVRSGDDDAALYIDMHLVICDRTTMSIVVRELMLAYDAIRQGRAPSLPPLRIHYPDFAHWQRARLQGRALEALLEFWQRELGDTPALELPADRPRPPTPLGRGARHTVTWDATLMRQIKAMGAGSGLTFYMTLLAAFETLLHRLSGQESFAVGTPTANRDQPELEGVVGYFSSLLVFRADFAGAPSFRELMQRVRARSLAAYAHQELPFERIVEAIAPDRDPSRNPIFQVMLALQQIESRSVELPGIRLEFPDTADHTTAQFDLRVDILETPESLTASFEYSTELFDADTIARWARSFELLLRAAVRDPETKVSQLPLMDAAERRLLLETWNDTAAEFPRDKCLHEPFLERVERAPRDEAVVGSGARLDYAGLAARVHQLAHELAQRGVGPERLVGVLMRKGVEQVIATLAILEAGGAYLPLDPALPPARLLELAARAGAIGIILQPEHVDRVAWPESLFRIVLDPSLPSVPVESRPPLAPRQRPDQLAYVIYTSGSTGVPKGVALDGRGPVNTLYDINTRFGVGPGDRVLFLSSLSFDLSVYDIFGTLGAGGTVIVPDAERERDPAHWVELVAREKVTIWNSVPALFELFVEQLEQGNAGDPSSLRLALLSGDWIPVTLADRARRVIPGIQLESLGGATEASVWSISYPIGSVDPSWRSIPYGKPLKNQKFFVLDASLEPCPIGVAGELYIGGIGLALGYYNDPERTAESFFLHPKTGERLYRTGDHGRYLPSGDIEFLGRRDGQVKLRGYRVELGEIEAALRRHAKVREALVLVRPDARGERRLVAYVVGDGASAAELTEHLASILPAYMVASAFVMLEAFPLTANGKVDRKALPEPIAVSTNERAYDPPRGAVEEVIASIWAELFGLSRVGRDEHFFELGGHSILGTQAVARMRAALKAELPLRWIFEAPTVRAMAARVSELLERRQGLVAPALGHVPRDSGLALSFAQERALFLDRMLPGDPLHVHALVLDIAGALDTETLEQALGDLALRHPSLCTTLSMDGARAVQAIEKTPPELERVSRFDDWRPSALDGRLVRFQLLEHAVNRHELRAIAHRVALDTGSLELAARELVAIYAGHRKGQRHPLAPLPTRVVDLAQWERRLVEAPAFTAKLDAYAKRLRDVPALELPTDHARPAIQSFSGASVPLVLGGDVTQALSALARREGAPLFAVLCALTEVLLARHSGQSDFALGTSSAHARAEATGLAGTLENLIALRADGRRDITFRELVRSARDRTLEAYLDKDVPFEKLVEKVAPERDTSRHALFQAALTLRPATARTFQTEELQVGLHAPDDVVSPFDLSIELSDDPRGMEGKLVYKTALFERESVERLARRFEQLMASAIATPDAPAHRLDLLPAEERALVEHGFARSTELVERFVPLTERIRERARHSPDAPALEQRGRSLSYGELTDRIALIGAGLLERGVGSEELVGVCLGRTLELPTALLAVLGAGAAYLPLEPTEPDERLEYMIRDSGVRYVVTDSTTSDRIRNAGAEPLPIDELARSAGPSVVVARRPDQLAYVIYTSGSTGRPKGVEVTHGGLDNFLQTMCVSPGITARDRLLAVTSPSFDIAALELYLPLLVGATVVLAPSDVVSDGEQLLDALASATILQATPATYRMLLAAGWRGVPEPERHLLALTGGEALAPSLASALSERVRSLWNVYGPTETTIWSTRAEISPDAARAPTIGRPLARTEVYVVDHHFEPVPIGVWGELLIGGAGVARGYRGREELTAERFVPDPIGEIPGARVYRTGDRCRWLSNGTLEFGGRFDHQIKLRGHRIELGEIEAVLSEHPGVGSAAVIVREDAGDPRLVGYVVPADDTAAQRANDGVARWRHVWDGLYERAEAESELDSSGYVSSYTRQPIPTDEMREWLDETIAHARASGDPRRVLELGCGTGMVISRLAGSAERYVGCDQSAVALERARKSIPAGANVELLQRPAHDFSGFAPGAFDTIILNSVVQYFPSVDYLLEVLRGALGSVAEGGRIFVGDVRSRSLLTPFAWSVEVHDAAPGMPIAELSARARSRARFEPELAIDPELFLTLANESERPMQVRFRRKITHAENELTLYRYDVVLELDAPGTTGPSPVIVAFDDCDNEAELQALLLRDEPEALILRDIVDPRLGEALFAMRACEGDAPRNVAELAARLRRATLSGIAPLRLKALATELGYRLETAPAARHGQGSYDALLTRTNLSPRFPLETLGVTRPASGFATDPERAERERGLAHELRGFLETRLPEYMLPAAYVLMDTLPLTTSGKVNRNALPAPSRIASDTSYIAPRTATEEAVARIFGDVLRLERISVDADFFALGGHSLLGTHVVTLIRQTLKADLPLGALFAHPTIGGLATQVDALLAAGKTFHDTPIAKASAEPALPLSYAQERMYFMHKLYGGAGVFNIPQHLRLLGPLDLPALRRAFDELAQRHEALRTVIREVDGVPLQIILPDVQLLEREIEDLSGLPQAERESRLVELGHAHAARSFDLTHGPLVHARVLKLRPDEHVLLVTMHHIVADGWSLGVLYTELSALYAAFAAGKASPLAPLDLQYADYAVWQRQWMQGDVLEQHVAWWKQRLLGAERLELPTDRPRPATRDIAGASVDSSVDRETTSRLRALCQEHGATLFMGLLAAFQALMHRYSGQDDIVIGTAIANRTRSEIGGLIGFFINTPAMRTDVGGNPSFHELLLRVKANALEVYDWQDAPFERIVEALHPVRDPARYPIYDVMFGLQNAPGGTLTRSSGIALRGVQAHTGFARYDLTVQVIDLDETLELNWEYALALFDASTAQRLAGHFTSLLEALCTTPERGVDHVDYLLPREREALQSFARPVAARDPVETETIHGRVERVASENPKAIAIVDPDGAELGYGELVSRARSLAQELVARGIGVEGRVAIALDRGQGFVVAMLATLTAGAAYVPLDPGLPAERLRVLARDSGASLLVTHSSLSEKLPAFQLPVVLVDAERQASRPLPPTVASSNAAYVIYTSGSTGTPKGVVVQHASAIAIVRELVRDLGVGASSQVLEYTPLSFDVSVSEILMTLFAGGTLHFAARDELIPSDELVELLERRRIDTLSMTASALERLPRAELPALRTLVVGGEPCAPETLAHWAKGRRVLVAYGPTEATITATLGATTGDHSHATLGRPLAGVHAFVLDRWMQLVPAGVYGELHLGGHGITRGYHGRPDLTAERFVPNPFGTRPGDRLYRTGDRVRWREDGTLEFGGRLDGQVKIRGFRIELGEVEAALASIPGIRQAVVVVRNERDDKRLVAYFTADEPRAGAELRAALEARLPAPYVPSAFFQLDELPQGPTGKLDRKALLQIGATSTDDAAAPPRTPTEEIVCGLYADLLRIERVGVTSSFFDLGGHSLLATQLVSRLRELFHIELPLGALFESPTPERLAARIDHERAHGASSRPPLTPQPRPERIPLSFAQERLWFLHQLEPASAVYNTPYVMRTGAPIDEAALQRALERLIRRHESLRTSFPNIDGTPAQRIHEHPVFELRSLELDPADEPGLERVLLDESLEPFAIEACPPLRILVVRLGATDSVVCLTLHHIVTDLFSMNVIARELAELYRAELTGTQTSLPPLELQYADYALWQRSSFDAASLERELALWKDRLADLEPLALPTDRARPPYPSHRGGTVPVPISSEVGAALLELARREGVTPFMTLLALFSAVLGRHADQQRFGIGFPISGRTDQKLEPLIGFFVNTLIARVDLSGRPSFRELLGRVREETLWVYAHQEVPFAKIVEAVAPERSTGTSPLFQAVLTFDHVADGVDQTMPDLDLGLAKVDLALSAGETRGALSAVLEYSQDLFDRARIERFARQLVTLATAAVAAPDRSVDELPLLDEAERHALVTELNPSARSLDGSGRALNELVLARARELGTEPALVGPNGERLSYTELSDQVRRRAAGLRARGVGPESIVALAMRRSPEIVIAMLAVLEAGGAYLPLDPSYPRTRLELMLADSKASLVISDRGESFVSNVATVDFGALATDPAPTQSAAHRDQAAYVIYTSGSTGLPKGVVVTHRGIVNTALAEAEALALGRGARVAPVASPSFDAFGWEIYAALLSGATLHFGSAEDIQPGQPFSDFLKRERIDVLSVVPSVLSVLPDPEAQALKVLVVGGEVAPRELLARFSERTRVFNSYGPTETAICATLAPIEHGGEVTLGRPLANVRTYVVDARLEPVPVGVFGELLIGGAGLARGYLDRPELTAERFVPDPFSTEPGARLYRTGDRACYRADGELEFGGRLDDQIKLRGFRIELGEIERALAAIPRVRTAFAALRDDRAGPEIAAYVVLDEPQPSTSELLSELASRLPAHMLPSRVTALRELPRTSTGKIDRRALAALEPDQEHAVALPRTPLETSLCELYSELLRCADIGIDRGFFELGGHSLLAVRLQAELGRRHGFHPQLSQLFNSRLTVADLAAMIEGREGQRSLLVPLNANHEGTPIFAIHAGATTVLGYTSLAAELQAPVFGLRPPGTVEGESIPESLERLAAEYASAIDAQQPSGPVNLIAHSLGGFIALDVARELQRRGRELGLVALLDTLWPFDDEPAEPSDDELHQELTGEPLGEGSVEQKRRRLQLVAERAALLPPGLAESELDRHFGVLTAIRRLVGRRIRSLDGIGHRIVLLEAHDRTAEDPRYEHSRPLWKRIARQGVKGAVTAIRRLVGRRIRPMDGVLHRPKSQDARYEHSRQCWNRIARQGFEIERVPGDHYSLLRPPHAASVARVIMRQLERTKGQHE